MLILLGNDTDMSFDALISAVKKSGANEGDHIYRHNWYRLKMVV